MNSNVAKIAVLSFSIICTFTFISCTSNVMLSVNHFQDATVLDPGESKFFMSFEEALFFQFIATKRSANDFGQRPYIVTPNYQLGIGKGFQFGVQLLPVTLSSSGVNLYLKYSNRLFSLSSAGIVLVGGIAEANGDNGEGIALNPYYSYKNSKLSNFSVMLPITVSGKYVAFTIAPSIGNYRADMHYTYTSDYERWADYGAQDTDNNIVTNYLVPSVSTGISFNLPQDSFISLEFTTLQIEHAVLGFYGVGFGMKGNLF
jgi:hypothetical protein